MSPNSVESNREPPGRTVGRTWTDLPTRDRTVGRNGSRCRPRRATGIDPVTPHQQRKETEDE